MRQSHLCRSKDGLVLERGAVKSLTIARSGGCRGGHNSPLDEWPLTNRGVLQLEVRRLAPFLRTGVAGIS